MASLEWMCNDRDEIEFGFRCGHDWDWHLGTHDHLSDNKIYFTRTFVFLADDVITTSTHRLSLSMLVKRVSSQHLGLLPSLIL